MGSVTHVKGVRTRFRNVLEKNVQIGKELLNTSVENYDIESQVSQINMCIQTIQIYSDKLEVQSEKLANVLEESDSEFLNEMTDNDCMLCTAAIECLIQLQQYKEELLARKEQTKMKHEETGFEQIEERKMMQRLMEMQLKQQEKLVELQQPKSKVSTVKLPKLQLASFNGDKTRWVEFWDSFKSSVHENKSLSNCEKFNYLRSRLTGEAERSVLGLTLSDANYNVAIGILQERFGNVQEAVDLHYKQLMSIQPALNKTGSLRSLLDAVERHFRSLEVLGQDTNQDMFVSMLRVKLPKDVLLQLEILNGCSNRWTIFTLRDKLKEYVMARERSDDSNEEESRKVQSSDKQKQPIDRLSTDYTSSAFALAAVRKPTVNIYGNVDYKDKCRYCTMKHWSDECPKYRTIRERKAQLRGTCFKCLKVGHQARDCKTNKLCVHCGESNAHHRSLCPKKFKQIETMSHLVNDVGVNENGATNSVEENVLISSDEMVLMQTAVTDIVNPETSKAERVRLILDSGSHRTYITQKLADKLNVRYTGKQELKIVTFGSNSSQQIQTKCAKVDVKLRNGESMSIDVNIVPTISGELYRRPIKALNEDSVKHLIGTVGLADTLPTESESSSIEMLVGNDYYLDLVLGQRIELRPGLYLLSSKFGWILTGRSNEQDSVNEPCMLVMTHGSNLSKTNVFASVDSVVPTKPELEDFWNVESIGIVDKQNTAEDTIALKSFRESVSYDEGRYQVRWPWIEGIPEVPDNRELALGRLKSCVTKLRNKPELFKKYDDVIKDQLCKGVIEKVDQYKTDGCVHYLPHHAIIKPDKATTKLRVVYDASAKTKADNKSLNESLYRGPVMIQDLCGMLIRFRIHPIAIVADIEKAFLQVGLQVDQRDVTRFLWLKDSSKQTIGNGNVQEYRFCRVPFGVISSPFLLGATVDFHLSSYKDSVAENLKNNIYVDNVITGARDIGEAKVMYTKAKSMFKDASMNLREWLTNNKELLEFIPSIDKADTNGVKVLGQNWKVEEDTLTIAVPKVGTESLGLTKRCVLKTIASVFDPLGLVSPILLPGKVLVQSLWQKQLDWDDEISSEDRNTWSDICSEISVLDMIQIKRCIISESVKEVKYTLVCFSDASEKAYSTVVYLHRSSVQGSSANIVFSKTRLAPVKKLTIPRLELLGVLIGVRCLEFVRKQLRLPVNNMYIWTDSKCVLHWLKSEKTLQAFVKNRVAEIKQNDGITFRYISTHENPADIATRGTTTEALKSNKIWWCGPQWLSEPEGEWPVCEIDDTEKHEEIEPEADAVLVALSGETRCDPPYGIDCEAFSSWSRLLRVTAWVERFVQKTRRKERTSGALKSCEIKRAELKWLLYIQRKCFQKDIMSIQQEQKSNLQRQLGLVIDEQNLLRCVGRLEHAGISEGSRKPILLPGKQHLTSLIIDFHHKELIHSGVSQTLARIRQRFWIVQGRANVKSVLRRCALCRRYEGGSYKMPPLSSFPESRVTKATPFSSTGLDYFGPVYVKNCGQVQKIWVCLFTCFVTRAVHLEVVFDMSTEQFLMAFRRFIAQRGTPSVILSDNAKQFKAARSVVESMWHDVVRCDEVQSYIGNAGIKWNFITQLAPWKGGLYERLVGVVKRAFRKALGKKLMTIMQIQTVLKEIEAVVNSRPLTYVGDDVNSTISLTPTHFLSLNPHNGVPEVQKQRDSDFSPLPSTRSNIIDVWKKGQNLLNMFWQIWRNEYLLSLRERNQTELRAHRIQASSNPNIGDIVIVKDNLPRGSWKIAKVEKLIVSRDGAVRSCEIALPGGNTLRRPINLLFPIEVNTELSTSIPGSETSERLEQVNKRPKRAASVKALEAIKTQLAEQLVE